MNRWLQLSIDYANQRSYLDDLFRVYPTIPDSIRELDGHIWSKIEASYIAQDNIQMVSSLLELDLFPIKDSYVAYLKRDKNAITRNPRTVARLAGRLYEMGLDKIWERCSEPKETNRQIGPMFRRYLASHALGISPVPLDTFLSSDENAILDGSDISLMAFAREHLGYSRNKGLDLVARFGGKYVLGEAKFLTDIGGHQNAQFQDALLTLNERSDKFITVAILDGVLYIPNKGKLYSSITSEYQDCNIMSALLLRDYLYSL